MTVVRMCGEAMDRCVFVLVVSLLVVWAYLEGYERSMGGSLVYVYIFVSGRDWCRDANSCRLPFKLIPSMRETKMRPFTDGHARLSKEIYKTERRTDGAKNTRGRQVFRIATSMIRTRTSTRMVTPPLLPLAPLATPPSLLLATSSRP